MNQNEVISGLTTGILTAILFNPIDKAIYVSTTKNLSILNKDVWSKCFNGTLNTILTRLVTSGLYFTFLDKLSTTYSPFHTAFITSFACNIITNPIQLIKYHSWYNNLSINESSRFIYGKYGIKGFGIGFSSIFLRDLCFNYLYLSYKKKDDHLYNLSIITFSLVSVSPFNLIKNKKYGSNESFKEIIKNFKFHQFGISKSVLRTSASFYFSQFLYDITKETFSKKY